MRDVEEKGLYDVAEHLTSEIDLDLDDPGFAE